MRGKTHSKNGRDNNAKARSTNSQNVTSRPQTVFRPKTNTQTNTERKPRFEHTVSTLRNSLMAALVATPPAVPAHAPCAPPKGAGVVRLSHPSGRRLVWGVLYKGRKTKSSAFSSMNIFASWHLNWIRQTTMMPCNLHFIRCSLHKGG